MKRVDVESFPVSIFIAGDAAQAEALCQSYCDAVGLCVTVTETNYVYTNGAERGVVVGLINYPRFPKAPFEIWEEAERLAAFLRPELGQESYTIQSPARTVWFSRRKDDV